MSLRSKRILAKQKTTRYAGFWAEEYYVSTVGLNDATVKKYIRDQERADIMQDKMSVKEYEDPFGAKPGKDPQARS